MKKGTGRGAYNLRRSAAQRIGSEGALDECGEHFDCSGVIPGGIEVQGLGKGSSSILAGGAADYGVSSGFDFLLAPWTKSWSWAMPI